MLSFNIKSRLSKILITIFALSLIGTRSFLFGQSLVQWNLTANSSPSFVNTNMNATPVLLSNVALSRTGTTSEPPKYSVEYGMATAPDSVGRSWNAIFDESKYVQFAFSVKSGYQAIINAISFDVGCYGGTAIRVAIYYSFNSDFSNAVAIVPNSTPIDNTVILVKNTLYPQNKNLPSSVTLLGGENIYVRVYSMYNTTGARWLLLRNFSIQGTINPIAPTIITSVSTLQEFSHALGSVSASQSYNVIGLALSNNVVIQPPAGFQISLDSINWIDNSSSLVLNQSGGILIGQPVKVYVRLNSNILGINIGNIIHTSSGASTVNVNVRGICSALFYLSPTGDVTNLSSWDSDKSGIGINPPLSFTSEGQTFVITNRHAVTLTSNWIVSGVGSKIVVGNGENEVNFIIPIGNTISGVVDITENGKLTLQNTNYPTFGNLHSSSTIVFDGSNTFTIPALNYGNLLSENDVGAQRILAAGKIGVSGIFKPGAAFYSTSNNTISFNGIVEQIIPTFMYNRLEIENAKCSTEGNGSKVTVVSHLQINKSFTIAKEDTVTLLSGATLTVAATQIFTVKGTINNYSRGAINLPGGLVIASGGNYIVNSNNGPVPSANAIYSAGSNLIIASCTDTASRIPSVGGNVIWNCPNQTAGLVVGDAVIGSPVFLGTSSGTYSIGGNLIIMNTGTGSICIGMGTTYRTLNINGDLIIQGGEFNVAGYHSSNPTNQTVNVAGNVIISSGRLFISSNIRTGTFAYLNVKRDIVHNGGEFGNASNAVSGVLTVNGTSDQKILSPGFKNILSLNINKQANLILGRDLVITGVMTLINGKIVLDGFNLTSNSISGGSANSYIVTDSIGALIRYVGASNVLFPIGLHSSYNPISLINYGVSDFFKALVQLKINSGIRDLSKIVNRQWVIIEQEPSGSDATVSFQWNADENNSGFNYANSIFVVRDSLNTWIPYRAVLNGSNPYTAIIAGVKDFGAFIVGNDSAFTGTVSVFEKDYFVPSELSLRNNYPNPFNPTTTIEFTLAEKCYASLKVYDLLGREVATLVEGEKEKGVVHKVHFNASNLPSGIYYYKLNVYSKQIVKKMVLLK